jgi:hypothetical protein
MKTILLLTCATLLLATTACVVSEGGYHGGYRGHRGYNGPERYHSRSAVIVPAPVVVVPVPVVRVRVD